MPLPESYRDGGKVKNRTLASLPSLPDPTAASSPGEVPGAGGCDEDDLYAAGAGCRSSTGC